MPRVRRTGGDGSRIRLPGGPDFRVRVLTRRTVLHVSAAALVLVGLAADAGLVALFLSAAWVLVVFCRRYTRSAKGITASARQRKARGFRYDLCAFGVLYLVPIGVAIALQVLLAVYLGLFSGSLGVEKLIALQRAFEASRSSSPRT